MQVPLRADLQAPGCAFAPGESRAVLIVQRPNSLPHLGLITSFFLVLTQTPWFGERMTASRLPLFQRPGIPDWMKLIHTRAEQRGWRATIVRQSSSFGTLMHYALLM